MLSFCLFLVPTVVDGFTYFLDRAVGFSLTLLVFRVARLLHVEKSKDAVVAVLPGDEAERAVEDLFGPKQGILVNAAVRAEKAGRLILNTYLSPNRTFVDLPDLINEMDPLRDFSEACRCELQSSHAR